MSHLFFSTPAANLEFKRKFIARKKSISSLFPPENPIFSWHLFAKNDKAVLDVEGRYAGAFSFGNVSRFFYPKRLLTIFVPFLVPLIFFLKKISFTINVALNEFIFPEEISLSFNVVNCHLFLNNPGFHCFVFFVFFL